MERNIALDIFKLVLALMVIGLHSGFLSNVSLLAEFLTVNGVFRVAVPLFLLINGFYFYSVIESNQQVSWLKRVLILYLTWMIFYSYFWLSGLDFTLYGVGKLLHVIVFGYNHLWYISGLVGASLIVLLLKEGATKNVLILISLLYISGVIIQYLGNYNYFGNSTLNKISNYHWVHRNFLFFSYPFFCLGYLIKKHNVHLKYSFLHVLLACTFGLSLLGLESYLNFYAVGRVGGFDNYISLILLCPAVFILFSMLMVSGKSKDISLYSASIFFVHYLFINLGEYFFRVNGTELTFIVIFLSLISSFFIVRLSKKYTFLL